MTDVIANETPLLGERDRITRRSFITRAVAIAGAAVGVTYPGPAWAAPVDLRDMDNPAKPGTRINFITPIKNQSSCNSCTAFAVVAAIEGTYNKKNNLPGTVPRAINLSEGQLFYAAGPKEKCEATHWWPEEALEYCARVGLAREDQEGFVTHPGSKTVQITRAVDLMRTSLKKTQEAMKNWISTKGPVIAVLAEYNDFFLFRGGNLAYFPDVNYPNKPTTLTKLWFVGGHTVAIVGYDDAQKYWICKNSYGDAWNGTGYVNIAYSDQNPNSLDAKIDSIDVWGVSLD
jgi:Papain family cysteine protease